MTLKDYLLRCLDDFIIVKDAEKFYTCLRVQDEGIETQIDEYGHFPLRDIKEFLDREVLEFFGTECYLEDGMYSVPCTQFNLGPNDK